MDPLRLRHVEAHLIRFTPEMPKYSSDMWGIKIRRAPNLGDVQLKPKRIRDVCVWQGFMDGCDRRDETFCLPRRNDGDA